MATEGGTGSKGLNDDECLVSRANTRPLLGFARSPTFINYAPVLIDVHRPAFEGCINYDTRRRAKVPNDRAEAISVKMMKPRLPIRP